MYTMCIYKHTTSKAPPMLFEWDETKRQTNLAKHYIDFQDAIRVFEGPVFERMDDRRGDRSGLHNAWQTAPDHFSQEGTSQ